ncbi:hypothetical protein BGZ65_001690 [Modicella reniformis]|uniref:Uncharacterized protein n=1 Tax=Modicella reniformis TaxID=1440133 RepID=A0A9P6MJ66_9FUNG|nr:hypothetical protein BGZ65_001690 [Modicella reniformis]
MLSFRSFHERHFSQSQRQVFFSGMSAPWFPTSSQPFQWTRGVHTTAVPSEHDDAFSTHNRRNTFSNNNEELEEEEETEYTVDEEGDKADSDDETEFPELTKEAIEIFEFSRRFRQEKEKIAQVEKARIKKRKIKRRKLTKLGVSFDEGNSGTEEGDNADEDEGNNGDDVDERQFGQVVGSDEDKGGSDSEDLDFELSRVESPATDVSFLNQGNRRDRRAWQRLYNQGNTTSQSGSDAFEGTQAVAILENLLNQAYVDSLGPQVSTAEKTEIDSSSEPRHGQGSERRLENRSSRVVYWPGIPLRC